MMAIDECRCCFDRFMEVRFPSTVYEPFNERQRLAIQKIELKIQGSLLHPRIGPVTISDLGLAHGEGQTTYLSLAAIWAVAYERDPVVLFVSETSRHADVAQRLIAWHCDSISLPCQSIRRGVRLDSGPVILFRSRLGSMRGMIETVNGVRYRPTLILHDYAKEPPN